MARKPLGVSYRLWDDWEEGTIERDKQNRVFVIDGKIHATNYQGGYLSVQEPLSISRSQQGRQ